MELNVPVADESLTGTLKCPVLQNLSQKNFYLQIEFTFPPKNLRLSNTEYSSNAYIESDVSKMNVCSDGTSKLLTLNLKVELCAKIN